MMTQAIPEYTPINNNGNEMNEQMKLLYILASQDLQKYLTNSIISHRNIDFYLKRTFEGDPSLNYYNFYRETDVTKLKLFIESLLKNMLKEDLDQTPQESGIAYYNQYGNEYLRSKELEDSLISIIHSSRAMKGNESEMLSQIIKTVKQNPQTAKLKNDLEYLINENEKCITKLEELKDNIRNFKTTNIDPRKADHSRIQEEIGESQLQGRRPVSESNVGQRMNERFQRYTDPNENDPNSQIPINEYETFQGKQSYVEHITLLRNQLMVLEKEIQERDAAIENMNLHFQAERELYEQKLAERARPPAILSPKNKKEDDYYDKGALDPERLRRQFNLEKEKLLYQFKELQKEIERKNFEIEEIKRQNMNEKEKLILQFRDKEEDMQRSREDLVRRLRERDEELTKQNEIIMSKFKSRHDELDSIETVTRRWKEKYSELERTAQMLREDLASRNDEIERLHMNYERKLVEKTQELQESKELLLAEIQESNTLKEKLNNCILESMEINNKLVQALREKEEFEAIITERTLIRNHDNESLVRQLSNFELRQEKEMKQEQHRVTHLCRELNGKIGELEGYVVRLKKQNDHLKNDNLRLAEIIETEAQNKEQQYKDAVMRNNNYYSDSQDY